MLKKHTLEVQGGLVSWGQVNCAQNLAVLQTLVTTCSFNDINPQHYLADVLIRTQNTPVSDIDSLLPMNWNPAPTPH